MKKWLLVAVLLLSGSLAARADYYSYAKLLDLSPDARLMYLTGTIDALQFDKSVHECLKRLDMTAGPLTDSVWNYLAARPNFHGKPIAFAVKAYLKEACSQ